MSTFHLNSYTTEGFYDEMFTSEGTIRPQYQAFATYLQSLTPSQLENRHHFVEKALLSLGITFNVYHEDEGTERIFPVDIIPRIIAASEWEHLQKGLKQRICALNFFLDDIYNDQKILKDKVIPEDIVFSSKGFLPPCLGLRPPKGIWCHITGTDLIRQPNGRYDVLEDNLRCPSGVSYVLENREVMKRAFSTLMQSMSIEPVSEYPYRLYELLQYISPAETPTIAVLTPGIYNSAYFEHSFLARQMGVQLVQPQDLVVDGGYLNMRTTSGLQRVDVLYRRIDDVYLDPLAFNPDSLLGVPGLFEVYKNGRLGLANAPGTGVADDKVVYAFVPDMIRYYLNETPLLENIPTYLCSRQQDLEYVVDHLPELVVKAANEAGGYGMLIGPHSSKEEQADFKSRILANPRNYIAQPTISFSRCPCFIDGELSGRHVDLRPYILYGQEPYILPGGLTRVALTKGSLVVNSSQGGGSKDTWVVDGC
jgi:uncharacterized circularly permuted ATP-grasp superfamily protein